MKDKNLNENWKEECYDYTETDEYKRYLEDEIEESSYKVHCKEEK